jgi:hypothetical protein
MVSKRLTLRPYLPHPHEYLLDNFHQKHLKYSTTNKIQSYCLIATVVSSSKHLTQTPLRQSHESRCRNYDN